MIVFVSKIKINYQNLIKNLPFLYQNKKTLIS